MSEAGVCQFTKAIVPASGRVTQIERAIDVWRKQVSYQLTNTAIPRNYYRDAETYCLDGCEPKSFDTRWDDDNRRATYIRRDLCHRGCVRTHGQVYGPAS
jgi:hypothetical protein